MRARVTRQLGCLDIPTRMLPVPEVLAFNLLSVLSEQFDDLEHTMLVYAREFSRSE